MMAYDQIAAFIVVLHRMLGHDKTAAYLGENPGDKRHCRLCQGDDPRDIFADELTA